MTKVFVSVFLPSNFAGIDIGYQDPNFDSRKLWDSVDG